jgi:hypothetical protein
MTAQFIIQPEIAIEADLVPSTSPLSTQLGDVPTHWQETNQSLGDRQIV